ncbi:uncharacterized protein LOC124177726 [Neodiprion fabricii]|uniref:uncharacterized protein LOC124177726 n=1 Tax=Neodiprion fabricii TaxID=2872261 RepID=UPI001ED91ACD|nr:uncharacterized protein LOC124177726 [Neodiprion fabricii]
MKILIGYCVLCIFLIEVQGKPQITKLFPVKELAAFHERTSDIKPLDKLLAKLQAGYNFVFNRAEDTSNVEKILSNDEPNPDVEALKLIWANVISPLPTASSGNKESDFTLGRSFDTESKKENEISKGSAAPETVKKSETDDWVDGIEAPKTVDGLELQENSDDDSVVETTTPTTLQLPAALGRHLLEWLGSLLNLTYGAYTRVAQAVKP